MVYHHDISVFNGVKDNKLDRPFGSTIFSIHFSFCFGRRDNLVRNQRADYPIVGVIVGFRFGPKLSFNAVFSSPNVEQRSYGVSVLT